MAKQKDLQRGRSRIENSNLSRTQISNLIDEWIFNERNRAILKRRLLDQITYDELAEEFSLSVQQVKTIVYKSQTKLFKHMGFD